MSGPRIKRFLELVGSHLMVLDHGNPYHCIAAQNLLELTKLVEGMGRDMDTLTEAVQHYNEWLFDVAEGDPAREALRKVGLLK